jgi:putative FmdB family regulatory protein
MPIYEFYCSPCNTVFSFFSRGVNTKKIPRCPVCRLPLKRQLSLFARGSGKRDEGESSIDDTKMEKAMAMLASETERLDENDPRQAAQLMRKLSDATGLSLGSGMEEALRRLEKGEDPDLIEEEMGDLLDGEEPFMAQEKGRKDRRQAKPRVDETLYDL